MTTFNKSVSWSKFKMALDCPLQLKWVLDKKQKAYQSPARSSIMGKLVQKVFELYFSEQYNLKPNGQRLIVLERILDKVMVSSWGSVEKVVSDMRGPALEQIVKGYSIFDSMKLLNRGLKSELHMKPVFKGFKMYGVLDFVLDAADRVGVYDGKGTAEKDADERQIYYYSLIMIAAGRVPHEAGFLYWKHQEWVPVDVTPAKMKEFIEGEFARGKKVFDGLRVGKGDFPANPSENNCFWCSWRKSCPESYYLKPRQDVCTGIQEVSFK